MTLVCIVYRLAQFLTCIQFSVSSCTDIGIGIGYWHWGRPILLGSGCLFWYRSNPSRIFPRTPRLTRHKYRVHHVIPTDSVPTDSIPTIQSGRWRRVSDCSWIGLRAVQIGKTSNQIPKIRGRGQYNCVGALEVHCNFSGKGAPQTSPEYPPHSPGHTPQAPLPSVPGSMTCFRCMRRLDPLQFYSNFYHSYICLSVLKMYWVVLTVDCRNALDTEATVPSRLDGTVATRLRCRQHNLVLAIGN